MEGEVERRRSPKGRGPEPEIGELTFARFPFQI